MMKKRTLCLILALAAILCAGPVSAAAGSGSYSPGDIVTFGEYEQDHNRQNGAEPIEWIVLDTDGDYLFLVSRYILDRQRYNKDKESTTW